MRPSRAKRLHRDGFTLIEMLVVLAVIGLLTTLAGGAVGRSLQRAKTLDCKLRMRNIGQAVYLYAQNSAERFPRSLHSAAAHKQPNWAQALLPYLGEGEGVQSMDQWELLFERHYRCPMDPSRDPMLYSYGLNVHFELDPAGDSYTGSPRQWRNFSDIPRPSSTILMAEVPPIPFGDHVMAHLWSSPSAARNAVAHERHRGGSVYLFVDGSVRLLPLEETYDPAKGLNAWNPSLAR